MVHRGFIEALGTWWLGRVERVLRRRWRRRRARSAARPARGRAGVPWSRTLPRTTPIRGTRRTRGPTRAGKTRGRGDLQTRRMNVGCSRGNWIA